MRRGLPVADRIMGARSVRPTADLDNARLPVPEPVWRASAGLDMRVLDPAMGDLGGEGTVGALGPTTLAISANTGVLSGPRLSTQFEFITSTDWSGDRTSSIMPCRNSTFSTLASTST